MLAYAHRKGQLFESKLYNQTYFSTASDTTQSNDIKCFLVMKYNYLYIHRDAMGVTSSLVHTVVWLCLLSFTCKSTTTPSVRYELPGDAWLRLIARWNSTWKTILVRVKSVARASVNVDLNTFQCSPECTLRE